MSSFNYIVWAADPDLFHLGGLTVRWYGLLFALGFLISQQILFYIFRKEGHKEQDVETLTIYMVIATILGARLGHVFFYEPARYLANPIDILKIWEGGLASHGAAFGILVALYLYSNYDIKYDFIKFKGTFKKRKREGQSYLWVVDRIVIVVALTGCLIRFGNFMNSEIVGKPTESTYGVVFARNTVEAIQNSADAIEKVEVHKPDATLTTDNMYQPENPMHQEDSSQANGSGSLYYPVELTVHFKEGDYTEEQVRDFVETRIKGLLTNYQTIREDMYEPAGTPLNYQLTQRSGTYMATISTFGIPRHPAQLYESISSLLIFMLLFYLWSRKKGQLPEGQLLGLFLIILFGLRFLYEFLKENQVDWENNLPLNMGQWLSIPLVLIGIILLFRVRRRTKKVA